MTKTAQVRVDLEPGQKARLEEVAEEDARSVASTIRLAIDDYLRGRGKRRRGGGTR